MGSEIIVFTIGQIGLADSDTMIYEETILSRLCRAAVDTADARQQLGLRTASVHLHPWKPALPAESQGRDMTVGTPSMSAARSSWSSIFPRS
jgi:hypothetical protein